MVIGQVAVTSGSRSNAAATRRRIARRRRATRYAGSPAASQVDQCEPSKRPAPREEAREELLARESPEVGHERDC